MSSWIKIENQEIVRYSDGPHNLPVVDGWLEVEAPARKWKLDVNGDPVLKTRAELDADKQVGIDTELADRQRIGNKIQVAIIEATDNFNPVPLRNLLTKLVLKFRDLEKEL